MKFGNLHLLWLLWLIPIVGIFYIWAFKRKNTLIEKFVSPQLKERLLADFSINRQRLKAVFILIALLFAVLSLIRPQWGFHWEEVKRNGVDIIVALDVSKSMLAQDVSPNRLERAKREIIDLINVLQGDRLGLIAFAGTSFLQSPLTLDYGAVRIFLDDLDTNLIPVPGTAIAEAITKSIEAFDQQDKKSRVLILITDGEDHQGQPIEAAKKAADQGIRIYAIGIGALEGAPIPDEAGGFKKDQKGDMILTQLDETTLQKIALETGGSYVRSVTGDLDLETIYKDINEKVQSKELKSGKRQRFEERFQWPLLLAILFLLLEVLIRERKQRLLSLFILIFLPIFYSTQTQALSFGKDAQSDYDRGNYADAARKFLDNQLENPNDYKLKYNLANSYYKAQNYQEAEKLYQETIAKGDKDLIQKSYYNLGNTAFKSGKLPDSIKYYEEALKLNPDDKDAKFNLEFARNELKKRIEENKKRQQEQQQKQENQQCNNPNNKDDSSNDQKKDNPQKDDKNQQQQQDQKTTEAQDNKQKENQSPPPQEKQDEQKRQQQADAGKEDEKKMSQEEAERWLRALEENRKMHPQQPQQNGQRRYRVEKDW